MSQLHQKQEVSKNAIIHILERKVECLFTFYIHRKDRKLISCNFFSQPSRNCEILYMNASINANGIIHFKFFLELQFYRSIKFKNLAEKISLMFHQAAIQLLASTFNLFHQQICNAVTIAVISSICQSKWSFFPHIFN